MMMIKRLIFLSCYVFYQKKYWDHPWQGAKFRNTLSENAAPSKWEFKDLLIFEAVFPLRKAGLRKPFQPRRLNGLSGRGSNEAKGSKTRKK